MRESFFFIVEARKFTGRGSRQVGCMQKKLAATVPMPLLPGKVYLSRATSCDAIVEAYVHLLPQVGSGGWRARGEGEGVE